MLIAGGIKERAAKARRTKWPPKTEQFGAGKRRAGVARYMPFDYDTPKVVRSQKPTKYASSAAMLPMTRVSKPERTMECFTTRPLATPMAANAIAVMIALN